MTVGARTRRAAALAAAGAVVALAVTAPLAVFGAVLAAAVLGMIAALAPAGALQSLGMRVRMPSPAQIDVEHGGERFAEDALQNDESDCAATEPGRTK